MSCSLLAPWIPFRIFDILIRGFLVSYFRVTVLLACILTFLRLNRVMMGLIAAALVREVYVQTKSTGVVQSHVQYSSRGSRTFVRNELDKLELMSMRIN